MPLNISLPVGLFITPLKTRIEKFLFFSTYAASHGSYVQRTGYMSKWDNLGYEVSASLWLPSILDNERAPCVRLAVRTSAPEFTFKQMELLIEAAASEGTYQDIVKVYNIDTKTKIVALPSVPLRSLYFVDDNHIVQSFKSIRIRIISLNGSAIDSAPVLSTLCGTFDLLNERFVERWGTFWNLGAVDRAIAKKAHWFIYHLTTQKIYYASGSRQPLSEIPKALARHFVGHPLCWALTRPWFLKTYFWLPIFLRRKRFSDADG